MRHSTALLLSDSLASIHQSYWKKVPAFLTSLSLLIGMSSSLFLHHYAWMALFALYLIWIRSPIQLLILIGAFFWANAYLPPQELPTHEIEVIFKPKEITSQQAFHKKTYVYRGEILYNQWRLPCSIYVKKAIHTRPPANQAYLVKGTLQKRSSSSFSFKPTSWTPIEGSYCFAELRHQMKTGVQKCIHSKFKHKRVSQFMTALFTGELENKLLRYELGKVGLQHILAVSGFHFGMVLVFSSFFLQIFLARREKMLLLFFILSLYFFFIGPSPSVERSYLMAILYLLGRFLNRNVSALNLLGCGLCIELLYCPLIAAHIGFQLSFLSCTAILIFYPLIEKKLRFFLPKRTYSEIQKLSLSAQHGSILSTYLRQTISLTLSVNLVLIPLLLHHFQQFPLLSFIYNLFFPFLVSMALFTLLSSLIFHVLFPPIATVLFYLLDGFTNLLLQMVEYPPIALDFVFRTTKMSSEAVIFYLFVLLFGSISIPYFQRVLAHKLVKNKSLC